MATAIDTSKLSRGPVTRKGKRAPMVSMSDESELIVQMIIAAFGWKSRADVVNLMIEAAWPSVLEEIKKKPDLDLDELRARAEQVIAGETGEAAPAAGAAETK